MGARHVEERWQERGVQEQGSCEVCWAGKETGEWEGGMPCRDEEDEGMSDNEDEGNEAEFEVEEGAWCGRMGENVPVYLPCN